MEKRYLRIAKKVILSYFNWLSDSDSLAGDELGEHFTLKNDNMLLEHITIMKEIFTKAEKELEEILETTSHKQTNRSIRR